MVFSEIDLTVRNLSLRLIVLLSRMSGNAYFPYRRAFLVAVFCVTGVAILSSMNATFGDVSSPVVTVGGRTVPFIVSPFIGTDGQVFVPVDLVKLFAGTYAPDTNGNVIVRRLDGKSGELRYTLVENRYCVPIDKILRIFNASGEWNQTTRTFAVRARLELAKIKDSSLVIRTSYPVPYKAYQMSAPSRLIVDLSGVDLSASASTVGVSNPLVWRIRSGQTSTENSRIALDLKTGVHLKAGSDFGQDPITIDFGKAAAPVTVLPVGPPTEPLAVPSTDRTSPLTPAPIVRTGAAVVTAVKVIRDPNGVVTQVEVDTNTPVDHQMTVLDHPDRLACDFLGAKLSDAIPPGQPVSDKIVESVRSGYYHDAGRTFARVVLDLTRPLTYTFAVAPLEHGNGTSYVITLRRPDVIENTDLQSLAGRIIVVDPGHGGDDTGAVGSGGIFEKDLALSLGRKLRDDLLAAGAVVHMTRDSDVKPSVAARPQMAIAWHANLFVSIHCDEAGMHNSHTGTTVYFHGHTTECQELAGYVSTQLSLTNNIPSLGTRSDYVRFPGIGFGVLRGSPMPAILVECGYMNDDADLSKLVNPDIQNSIATGITNGLAKFFAEHSTAE